MRTKSLKKKKSPTGHVKVAEKMEMKILRDTGHNFEQICEATGRGYKAVKKGLADFEVLLIGNEDLYDKFEEERDKFVERMVQNSATIMVAADHMTMRKLPEASALEACKISQVHANRLDGLKNLSAKGLDGGDGQSTKVINFINQVFNIEKKNDKPEIATRVEKRTGGNEPGGQASGDEGVVQTGPVLPF